MITWIHHAVRNWRLKQYRDMVKLNQNLIVGKLPCEWQVREKFRELIQLSPIMDVIKAILEVRKFDKEIIRT